MPRPLLRLLRLLGAVALALAALVAVAGPASAHAELLSSSPADGATLDRAPARLVLRFTEPVEIDRTSVVLRTGAGAVLRVGRPVLRGHAPGSSADAVIERKNRMMFAFDRLSKNHFGDMGVDIRVRVSLMKR